MRKFISVLTMALLLLPVSFISCGDDDDDNVPDTPVTDANSTDSSDELDEYSQKFVGYWDYSGTISVPDFVFFPDKTCDCYGSSITSGHWGYDTSTNILATTTNNWQWTITLFTEEYWTGVSVYESKGCAFYKADDATYMDYILKHKQLVSSSNTDSIFSLSGNVDKAKLRGDYFGYTYSLLEISDETTVYHGNNAVYIYYEANEDDPYTFDYFLASAIQQTNYFNGAGFLAYDAFSKVGSGTITFSNIYSRNCRITFTGTINKVFTCFN